MIIRFVEDNWGNPSIRAVARLVLGMLVKMHGGNTHLRISEQVGRLTNVILSF